MINSWLQKKGIFLIGIFLAVVFTVTTSVSGQNLEIKPHKHDQPSETCFICDSSLREKGRLWCKEHTRYEDRCWLCHPDLEDKSRAFCKEHHLYEDECTLCHPNPSAVKADKTETSTKSIQNSEPCTLHNVAKNKCFICNPSLREKGRLWCKEHDRYEDRCWLCHPDLEDKKRAFCEEHGLYEDECDFCNPGQNKKAANFDHGKESSSQAIFCNEHNVAEIECGICHPELAATLDVGGSMKVRFSSKSSATKAGIVTKLPKRTMASPKIEALCRVNYNENQVALITPVVSGIIQHVFIDVGSKVKPGDVLVEIHSIEIAEAKTHFLSAIVDLGLKETTKKREKKLVDQKISATKEFLAADAAYQTALFNKNTAKQRLHNLGFDDKKIKLIESTLDRSSSLKMTAPFEGIIVSRDAVMGESVEPGKALFTLADLSTMWLELSIPVDQLEYVQEGLEVEATFQNLSGYTARGTLAWVDTSIDEGSRMLKARAIVTNNGTLKKGLFGHALIKIGKAIPSYYISKDAMQKYERNPFVFVKVEDDLFDFRRVATGRKNGSTIEILSGIQEDSRVVVAGTFTVMSEFLKSRLGAGCVDD